MKQYCELISISLVKFTIAKQIDHVFFFQYYPPLNTSFATSGLTNHYESTDIAPSNIIMGAIQLINVMLTFG